MKLLFVEGFIPAKVPSGGVPISGARWANFARLLKQAGIDPNECARTVLFKEKAPPFLHYNKHRVHGISGEFSEYMEILWDEVREAKAKIVVPLDDAALFALTGENSITNWRGSTMECRSDSGLDVKVLPTIHPDTVMQEALNRYYIIRDFQKMRNEWDVDGLNHPPHDFIIAPKYDEILEWLNAVKNDKPEWLSFDLEILNQQISCISLSTDITGYSAITIPFQDKKGDYLTAQAEVEVWNLLTELLEDSSIKKVAQNGIFDCTFLYETLGILVDSGNGLAMYDTLIAHKILYPDFKAGLGFLTSMYTEEPYYKDEGGEGISLGLQTRDFWVYAAKDASITLQVWMVLYKQLQTTKNWQILLEQLRTVPVYMSFLIGGIKLDRTKLELMIGSYKEEISSLSDTLSLYLNEERQKKGLESRELNPKFINSPKQKQQHYYEDMGLKPYKKKTKGGYKVTTDKDAMKRIARKGYKSANILNEISLRNKLVTTYFEAELDYDERVRGNWNPHGTDTGRPSSRKIWRGGYGGKEIKRGVNMLNLPPKMKACLQADKGHLIVQGDWSQIENRIVAIVSQDKRMMDAFENDIDVHSLTYAMMFDKKIEEVSADAGSCPLGDGTKSERYWGKICNHSLNYGLGYRSFSFRFEIPERDGKKLIERYHEVYPNVRSKFHEDVKGGLLRNRTVTNCYGRERRFLGHIGNDMYENAYAQLPQSTVADKANNCLHRIYNDLRGIDLISMVYDSVIFQIPITDNPWVMFEKILNVQYIMEEPIPWKTPFVVPTDFEIGHDLGNLKGLDMSDREGSLRIIEELCNAS